MKQLMTAAEAKAISAHRLGLMLTEADQERIIDAIKQSTECGSYHAVLVFQDNLTIRKASQWLERYGYRTYMDAKNHFHIVWN